MRLLALDLGEARIGLAVGGDVGGIIFPAGHLLRTKLTQDIRSVVRIAGEKDADAFVVGVPYSLDGGIGPMAKRALGFIRYLQRSTSLAVYAMDERFTSVEAEALLREAGREPSRDKGSVDEAAAVLILQRFLEQQKGEGRQS